MYSFSQEIEVSLHQLMADTRRFSIDSIRRSDLTALTEEAAKVSGTPYVMPASARGSVFGTHKSGA